MILGLVLFLAIGLTLWFIVFTEASVLAKVVVGALFAVSLLLRHFHFSWAGLFLQIGLCIGIALYHKVQFG